MVSIIISFLLGFAGTILFMSAMHNYMMPHAEGFLAGFKSHLKDPFALTFMFLHGLQAGIAWAAVAFVLIALYH